MQYLRKRTAFNPNRGHTHFRSPAKILWRTVRGMLPHKTPRGEKVLGNLKTFEGVPPPYDKTKKMVVPAALRVLRLKPMRPFTDLGRLSSEVGWKYKDVVQRLEDKRKKRSQDWYNRKKKLAKLRTQAVEIANAKLTESERQLLANYGY
uniref:Ribosomal protein L13a n=1 Tax=Arcella intermedia TaxID=1963864 RepID=A0A6B2LJ73_9EUKA